MSSVAEWPGMTMPVPGELDTRGRRLRAALAAVLVRHNAPELRLVHEWLDAWSGLGLIVAGMTHQGWDVQLTAYAARDWRANFFPVGIAHSIVGGPAWERTPWRAVQRAAWEVLNTPGARPARSRGCHPHRRLHLVQQRRRRRAVQPAHPRLRGDQGDGGVGPRAAPREPVHRAPWRLHQAQATCIEATIAELCRKTEGRLVAGPRFRV
jgi:hypothetical protein